MPKSMAEQYFQQGEARGERRGEMHVQRKNTLTLLELRFDDVPADLVRKINAMRSLSRLAVGYTKNLNACGAQISPQPTSVFQKEARDAETGIT